LLIFYPPFGSEEYVNDDWVECETVDFYPWYNILGFENIKRDKVLKKFDETDINKWLSSVRDPQLEYPYVAVRQWGIAFINLGTPRSFRSKGAKRRALKEVEAKKQDIEKLYPHPWNKNVEMKIDVFLEDIHSNDRPDVDRLSSLIMDSFKGVAYNDDRQIRDLRPRILDVSEAFKKLECTSDPMPHFSLNDIPTGSMFPLAIGIKNYYIVRIIYYY